MLEIIRIFNQLRRKIVVVLLAGFVWFTSLPATSSQAAGYYSGDFSTGDPTKQQTNSVITAGEKKAEEKMGRYANIEPDIGDKNQIESGKQAGVSPKDLGTKIGQNNPLKKLQRAVEKLGDD